MVRRRTTVFWRFLREHNIDLAARKFWCESDDPEFTPKAADVVVLCVDEKIAVTTLPSSLWRVFLDHLINRRG